LNPADVEVKESEAFDVAIEAHDAAVSALGLDIWLGNEPTFTDRFASSAEWLTAALGEDKYARAGRLLAAFASERPGCVLLRTLGRQYPGEPLPRWSLGLYARRDGAALWSGPADPLLSDAVTAPDLASFAAGLESTLASRGFRCQPFLGKDGTSAACRGVVDTHRLVLARAGVDLPDPANDGRLLRPSIHEAPIPAGGCADELAAQGLLLLVVSILEEQGAESACIELPCFDSVEGFLDVLAAVSEAARACALPSLVLRGFPPPVDASVTFTTVTPDPAVVEVNMAPHPDVRGFLRDNRRVYAAAAHVGLEPYRLFYNGAVADSGGGGQITFGGPSPERSPFFVQPRLLPRLIRYALRHPSLSYLFAHDFIGASGQSVRPDEHGLDALGELKLALALLDREASPSPGLLWQGLAPSLTDPVGNSHRAEINIEKLWNPDEPGRGQLGLVEFRAFRMQHTPERAAALAALIRAILAMLVQGQDSDGTSAASPRRGQYQVEQVAEWGAALHDRFALPYYLEADLASILCDLEEARLPLGPPIRAALQADACRPWSTVKVADFTLTVRQAIEFWSLLGDATHQHGTSRLVDASCKRIELALRPTPGAGSERLESLRLQVEGVELPMRVENDSEGPVRLFGVRYRAFVPRPGLHPTLGAQVPLRVVLLDPARDEAVEVVLHEWRSDGEAYDGLPTDLADAQSRRAARVLTRRLPVSEVRRPREAPRGAMSPYSLDLRYVT
jgi:uncharacterized protein (DUF2126 family)